MYAVLHCLQARSCALQQALGESVVLFRLLGNLEKLKSTKKETISKVSGEGLLWPGEWN
jgi:hypothetical protein